MEWLQRGKPTLRHYFLISKITPQPKVTVDCPLSNSQSLLHSFGDGAQITGGNLHHLIFTCYRIKNALLLDIHLEGPARVAQRVASGVPESGSFASFDASA